MRHEWEWVRKTALIVVLPILLWVVAAILSNDAQTQALYTLGGAIIYLAIIVWELEILNKHSQALRSDIAHEARITPLADDQFYPRWRSRLQQATRSVSIMYLDTRPPGGAQSTDKADYYKGFAKLVKKSSLPIRRIDRAHPNLKVWIESLISELGDAENFSYAVWLEEAHDRESLEVISTQIIDERIVFLVAAGAQRTFEGARDIEVESPDFARVYHRYYNELWQNPRTLKLIERGRVRPEAVARLQSYWQQAT